MCIRDRVSNVCQISYRDATVTGSQDASDAAGKRSEMAHQLAIMAKALKRDMEEALCKKGAKVNYYDPSGEKKEFRKIKNCNYKNNIKSNCNGADLVVLLTEWDEFKSIDFKKIVKNNKFKVYDLRNLYSAEEMKKNKIKYYSVGRPNTN